MKFVNRPGSATLSIWLEPTYETQDMQVDLFVEMLALKSDIMVVVVIQNEKEQKTEEVVSDTTLCSSPTIPNSEDSCITKETEGRCPPHTAM